MKKFTLSTEKLMSFYRSELRDMCKACPFYGRFYSCPPVNIDLLKTLALHETSYVIIEYAQSLEQRKSIQLKMDSELKSSYNTVFSAGKCPKCERCLREIGKPCSDYLYSAETLNLDMFALYEYLTGEKLQSDTFFLMYIVQ